MTAARRPDPTPDEAWHVDRGRTVRPWPGEEARAHDDAVTIDCDTCAVRGSGCGDCVVTVLLGGPPYGVELDVDEQPGGVPDEGVGEGRLARQMARRWQDVEQEAGDETDNRAGLAAAHQLAE